MSIQLQKLSLKAKLFRGLGDSTRLSILESLREGEKTTSQIVAETSGQSQSNISNHLSCLLDCGLVKNRRQGKNIFYRLGDKKSFKAFGIALEYLRLFDNDVPIKVTVNVKTKSIEGMEIANEIIYKKNY